MTQNDWADTAAAELLAQWQLRFTTPKVHGSGRRFARRVVRRLGRSVGLAPNVLPAIPGPTNDDIAHPSHITAIARSDAMKKRVDTVLAVCGETNSGPETADQLRRAANLIDVNPARDDVIWLLSVALLARYPTSEQMESWVAERDMNGAVAVVERLAVVAAGRADDWPITTPMELVECPLVDVSYTATRNVHTGVQRVVRAVVPRWDRANELKVAVFDSLVRVHRPLSDIEQVRIFNWDSGAALATPGSAASVPSPTFLVPWQTTLLMPEVSKDLDRSQTIAPLGVWSGSTISLIFYDFIPFNLPEVCNESTRLEFADYMIIVRAARRVSTISQAVADDVIAFTPIFQSAGFKLPEVKAHLLPITQTAVSDTQVAITAAELSVDSATPMVLSVGTLEPRKNQIRTLRAAEALWRQGFEFQLIFVAGGGWSNSDVGRELEALKESGRKISVVSKASEQTLWSAYRLARFTVFVSVLEGYGLPAAESIAAGTPVLLSNVGSMREIGAAGGVEFIDPRNQSAITEGMRLLLADDAYLENLRKEVAERPHETWDDYATKTWGWLAEM